MYSTDTTLTRLLRDSALFKSLDIRRQKLFVQKINSLLHCLIVVPLSTRSVLGFNGDIYDVFEDYEPAKLPLAISLGYFLYDFSLSALDPKVWGWGLLVHAASCLLLLSITLFNNFILYFATTCNIWEISTIFLCIHGLMRTAGYDKGLLYTVNGILLVLSFFLVRICYGIYQSYLLWTVLLKDTTAVWYLPLLLEIANLITNVLNIYWMFLLFKGLIETLFGSGETKKKPPVINKAQKYK